MGNKSAARKTMMDAGVPVVPGTKDAVYEAEAGQKIADDMGYPVMIKASAGGGGKGMRVCYDSEDFVHTFETAKLEAENAFGDGTMYIEKYIEDPRHIEFQILADKYGNTIHLGERDCSIQRRHQKLIEESPSPAITEKIRKSMNHDAILAAKAVGYTNAGTIEFILDPKGTYYFMEMNTRIQVEHGVTEMVTGTDLIIEQIRVAMGMELSFTQEDVEINGHAIECRINARSTGRVEFLHIPGGGRVHFDTALMQDTVVVPFYDSMLGKLIVHANTREEAIRRMEASLCEMVIVGVETNIEEQLQLIRSKIFQKGNYDTLILDKILKKG